MLTGGARLVGPSSDVACISRGYQVIENAVRHYDHPCVFGPDGEAVANIEFVDFGATDFGECRLAIAVAVARRVTVAVA
jgi:hypothetical protein